MKHHPASKLRTDDGYCYVCLCGDRFEAVSRNKANGAFYLHAQEKSREERRERRRTMTGPESSGKRPIEDVPSTPLHRHGSTA